MIRQNPHSVAVQTAVDAGNRFGLKDPASVARLDHRLHGQRDSIHDVAIGA